MCMGVPRQIVEVVDTEHGIVRVDAGEQGRRDVSAAILFDEGHDLGVGDWVDVHLGFALEAMTEEEARESLDWLADLAQADPFVDTHLDGPDPPVPRDAQRRQAGGLGGEAVR